MERLSRLSRSIRGQVAIVTGAASGMGRATARLFADEGASVACLDISADAVATVADEIVAAGGSARAWPLDVADDAAVPRVVGEIVDAFGGVDILVNNAGISRPAPFDNEAYRATWDATLDINLTAHVRMIDACLPHLQEKGAGRVVNIASTEGLGATAYITAYTAAKHGVIGLTRGLAVELGATGVTVNCVCPGPIHTGMTEAIPDDAKRKYARRRVPLRRYGDPEEVAHGTLGLVLPASSFINGAVLVVDGGLTVQNT